MKIVSIVGARPQFIKYGSLSKALREQCKEVLVHTGQHYDYNMNKIFFDELGIPNPDYNLGVGPGTHAYQTGKMLMGIEEILTKEKPDKVMVYGDTNSTIAGALASIKMHIKVAHVEAGLRSFDRSMPEEINRILTDHCSDYLFCPTRTAVNNLKHEGINKGVYLTGDVMVDALDANKRLADRSTILEKLKLKDRNYIVMTLHRASNTDSRANLESIVNAISQLNKLGETIVFPVHPRTEKMLRDYGLYQKTTKSTKLIHPLGYFDFLKLMNYAKKIITDSGGVQKEAYILEVPCITIRENTEWTETIDDGWNILAGVETKKIVELALKFKPKYPNSALFGKFACEKIAYAIKEE